MRILVTGAYGFIGSKIVEKLCVMGHDVTAMDNSCLLYTSPSPRD